MAAGGLDRTRVVMIESDARIRELPYQRKKLVLLLSAMRHYAEALRRQGYVVDYRRSESFEDGLRQHAAAWQPDPKRYTGDLAKLAQAKIERKGRVHFSGMSAQIKRGSQAPQRGQGRGREAVFRQ